MIGGPKMHRAPSTRDSLDSAAWHRVQQTAHARAAVGSALAARDEAIITLLGACGLRNEEVRSLRTTDRFHRGRRAWLRVIGKGRRQREFPLTAHVTETLRGWDALRPAAHLRAAALAWSSAGAHGARVNRHHGSIPSSAANPGLGPLARSET